MDKKLFDRISDTEIYKFLNEHKNKTGWEFRLELLNRSKEDIHDILDFKYQDMIHEWRQALFTAQDEVKQLKNKIIKLESQPGHETDWEASH